MAPVAAPPRLTPAAALAAAWLVAVALVAALERTTHALSAAALACSPERLVHGAVWSLATSAVVIDGPPVGQLLMTALATAWAVAVLGGRGFWLVAVAGHIGATLLTYAGIAVLWLVVGARVEELVDAPDFGISAVWAALLGALVVVEGRRGRGTRRRAAAAMGVVTLVTFVLLVPLDGELADVEHLLAFVAGALTAAHLQSGSQRAAYPA